MRRASVLVAVTAVSLVIVSACTSFPDLSTDEAGGDDDAASSSNGDDGSTLTSDASGGGGGGEDGSPATKQDGSTSGGQDGSTGTKDAASGPEAGKVDSGPVDPCTVFPVNCGTNPTCTACKQACPKGCTYEILGGAGTCCASEDGKSNNYSACCYYLGGSCTLSCR